MGRPTIYSDKLATAICARLAGGESLRSICRDEHMPVISTVLLWVIDGKHQSFSEQYAFSRQVQAECLADELLDIADDGSNDWMERNGEGNVGYQINGENVQRSRLRVDTRKWYLSKIVPRFKDKEPEQQSDLSDVISKLIDKLPA